MSTSPATHCLIISGDVRAPGFDRWIETHARKLGMGAVRTSRRGQEVMVEISSGPEMADALALACSLGPKEVLVDKVDIRSL